MNACQSKELHEKKSNNDCRIDIPETTKAELCPRKTESLTFSCNIITQDVISSNPFQKTNHINMLHIKDLLLHQIPILSVKYLLIIATLLAVKIKFAMSPATGIGVKHAS
ncbi:hypothetical protein CWI36_0341p0030 [Hamiltosporidium magnivora]|uniref:Uncharacterized protein n=1 Tax=Hamiltosporidium magnivora TaxID=148818 RepID=A0A4Q9LG24_9MICR|nr:hypothetical protein CWI36_0341p0030 [Hamiltosporidium magnivora]